MSVDCAVDAVFLAVGYPMDFWPIKKLVSHAQPKNRGEDTQAILFIGKALINNNGFIIAGRQDMLTGRREINSVDCSFIFMQRA